MTSDNLHSTGGAPPANSVGKLRQPAPALPETGRWLLPSGREVTVIGRECWTGDEACVLIELDHVICVVLDPEPDDDLVSLALYWRNALSPVGSRPYNCEASVLFDADDPEVPFAIIPAPAGGHGECCPGCDEEQTSFRTAVRSADIGAIVGWLAGLPRRGYRSLGGGLTLWRGAWAPDRRAAIEFVTDDLLRSEDRHCLPVHGPSTVSVVDLGLG